MVCWVLTFYILDHGDGLEHPGRQEGAWWGAGRATRGSGFAPSDTAEFLCVDSRHIPAIAHWLNIHPLNSSGTDRTLGI